MANRDLIAFLRDGRVLLEAGELPQLEGPESASSRAVLDRVGADSFGAPARRLADGAVLHVVTSRNPAPPTTGSWVALEEGATGGRAPDLLSAEIRAALLSAARQRDGLDPLPVRRPEWFRAGWLDRVEEWVDRALEARNRSRTGPAEVVKMWSISAVARVPTTAGPVYLKATSGNFRAEPTMTDALAALPGNLSPLVIATVRDPASGPPGDDERAWMLLEELVGIDDDQAPGAARALAPLLADLQSSSVAHVDALRRAGCPDRTVAPTLAALDEVVRDSVELPRLTAEERAEARAAVPRMTRILEELWDCGLPATLVHGDLHVGNVAYDGRSLRIFDWTDAAISHPFLDAAHLAHWSDEEGVMKRFTERWRVHRPGADLQRAARLAPVANRAYQAISYEGIYRAQEEGSLWELEGFVADFLRRLPRLVETQPPAP
jgi:hypothetical protein